MVINTNTAAQVAANNLQHSQALLNKSLARLSSGSKIVNPSDDAAGLAVSQRMDAQIQRLAAANANVGNALSFIQTQDGYMAKIAKALDRMSELTMLAQDATKTDADRALYQTEFSQIAAYVQSAASKDFNGVSLFSTNALEVTTDSEGTTFSMTGVDLGTTAYTDALAASIGTASDATATLTKVKTAINQLSGDRATLGAYQTRLSYTSEQLSVSKQNLAAANSRIRDVDVAEEATEYAKENILVQSGTAMLAQANQVPQSVLRLLQ
jgi:flagellin